ncbi:hypothetical protein BJF78_21720 [Pseudonocardia sp. CNS-139]|nr:hypothetical protein BJF78_21720 [Pseudonocardia sp. CNS-139]
MPADLVGPEPVEVVVVHPVGAPPPGWARTVPAAVAAAAHLLAEEPVVLDVGASGAEAVRLGPDGSVRARATADVGGRALDALVAARFRVADARRVREALSLLPSAGGVGAADLQELLRPALAPAVAAVEAVRAGPGPVLLTGGVARTPLLAELLDAAGVVDVTVAPRPELAAVLGAVMLPDGWWEEPDVSPERSALRGGRRGGAALRGSARAELRDRGELPPPRCSGSAAAREPEVRPAGRRSGSPAALAPSGGPSGGPPGGPPAGAGFAVLGTPDRPPGADVPPRLRRPGLAATLGVLGRLPVARSADVGPAAPDAARLPDAAAPGCGGVPWPSGRAVDASLPAEPDRVAMPASARSGAWWSRPAATLGAAARPAEPQVAEDADPEPRRRLGDPPRRRPWRVAAVVAVLLAGGLVVAGPLLEPRAPRRVCSSSTATASTCPRGGSTPAASPSDGACCSRPRPRRTGAISSPSSTARSATTRTPSPHGRGPSCTRSSPRPWPPARRSPATTRRPAGRAARRRVPAGRAGRHGRRVVRRARRERAAQRRVPAHARERRRGARGLRTGRGVGREGLTVHSCERFSPFGPAAGARLRR